MGVSVSTPGAPELHAMAVFELSPFTLIVVKPLPMCVGGSARVCSSSATFVETLVLVGCGIGRRNPSAISFGCAFAGFEIGSVEPSDVMLSGETPASLAPAGRMPVVEI